MSRPSLSIGTTPQTIGFTSLAPSPGELFASYQVSATATSGLAVVFGSTTPWTCSVTGDMVSLDDQGTCTIEATQPGNEQFAAASPVQQSFEIAGECGLVVCVECFDNLYWGTFPCNSVAELSQTLSFTTTPPSPAYAGNSYSVAATSSLGLTPAFSSMSTNVCTVAGSSVSLIGTGTCTVAANQPGQSPDKLPAPQITQSFAVSLNWPFTGLVSPISNTKLNTTKAGSTVPVKFSLGGDRGLSILAAGSPSSVQLVCPAGAPSGGTVASTTAKSGLSYNALTDTYTYVWETKASWKGTCRTLTVKLGDNSTHVASFKF
jgi:hypothetical protein